MPPLTVSTEDERRGRWKKKGKRKSCLNGWPSPLEVNRKSVSGSRRIVIDKEPREVGVGKRGMEGEKEREAHLGQRDKYFILPMFI